MSYVIPPEEKERLATWMSSPEGRAWSRERRIDEMNRAEISKLIELEEAVDAGWVNFAWLMVRRSLARTRVWPFTLLCR